MAAPEYLLAGIEAGGTSVSVAVSGADPTIIIDKIVIDTTNPQETTSKVIEWLRKFTFKSLGIASFGPVDLNMNSKTYGFITSTPKAKWRMFDMLGTFKQAFPGVSIGFDTDVNAAAIGEYAHGEYKVSSLAYVTVGTGIGVGAIVDGRPVHGLLHPETGHILVRKRAGDEEFTGTCPFHGDCLEGVASAGAISSRLGISASELAGLPDTHPVWDTVAYYLAQLCMNLTLAYSPEVIILGGGVLRREILYAKIRVYLVSLLGGYIQAPKILEAPETYVRPPKYAGNAGIVGALELARRSIQ